MEEFLDFLGDRVKLNGFKGYPQLICYFNEVHVVNQSGFVVVWILAVIKLAKNPFILVLKIEK